MTTPLITRLEEAAEGSRTLDIALAMETTHVYGFDSEREIDAYPHPTTSIDDALALAERLGLTRKWNLWQGSVSGYVAQFEGDEYSAAPTPALAFCLAILQRQHAQNLLPCPLCGGEARLGLTNRVEFKDTISAFCTKCSCSVSRTGPTQSEATKREVKDAWNSRTPPAMSADHIGDAQGWRDIATAPRDGREIVAYSQDVSGTAGLPPFVSLCAWHPDAGFCTCELREVTHWMPLP